jgi:hypothetical protein
MQNVDFPELDLCISLFDAEQSSAVCRGAVPFLFQGGVIETSPVSALSLQLFF